MSFAAFKLLAAAVLALSLAGKVVASRAPPEASGKATAAAVGSVLRHGGYETRVVTTSRSPGVFVEAQSGRCRILAGDYPPHGTFDSVYRVMAMPIGRLRFIHRGSLLEEQPKLGGLFDYYVWRELGRVGIVAQRPPVIAIAASDACPLDRLDWRSTASLAA